MGPCSGCGSTDPLQFLVPTPPVSVLLSVRPSERLTPWEKVGKLQDVEGFTSSRTGFHDPGYATRNRVSFSGGDGTRMEKTES